MKFGALLMPSHPPERGIRDGQREDLNDLERLDALGFEEARIGEHFTAADGVTGRQYMRGAKQAVPCGWLARSLTFYECHSFTTGSR